MIKLAIDVSINWNCYILWVFTIETWRGLIADSCTFHLNLTCRNAAGFIPIYTWQQRASMPLKPAQGHRLQVKIYRCLCLWRNDQTISITINTLLYHIGQVAIENAQNNWWTRITIRYSVFDCHWLPVRRQTAIEDSVSSYLRSTFVDGIYVFDRRLLKCLLNICLLNT